MSGLCKDMNGSVNSVDSAHLKHVLVVVDSPVSAKDSLRFAKVFAQKFDTQITVLHVIELRINPIGSGVRVSNPGIIQSMNENGRRELKTLIGRLWEWGIEATLAVRQGRPDEVIVSEACSISASLILMTLPRRGWLSRLLRPNPVKRVIRNAPCPVMVIQTGTTTHDTNCNQQVKPSMDDQSHE
jgi:nucleotide-binding universal stress UspA family protein